MESTKKRNKVLEIGARIPEFSLYDQEGMEWNSRRDRLGKFSVIYFYPKDESGICTKEACAFRDSFTVFTDAGVEVIGINSGTVESHKKFAVKNKLPFTLLSDADNKVLNLFGVKNTLFMTGRETFVFNQEGVLIFKFRSFLAVMHM